ncbi:MAG: hypothetical protein HY926_08440 [Elusimicrobia bacterium]|nr:hypothetical protein [Elusimicrobiota bacterium]
MKRSLPAVRWPWIAALAAASAAILCSAPAQYLGRQQDDIIYVIGSQSLAQGDYRIFTSIGNPPLVNFPPGFPLLLLPVSALWGGQPAAYQAFCALLLASLPWLLWRWLRRRLGGTEAALAALLFATSPVTLSQSGAVMSESAYTAVAVLLLAALEAGRRGTAGLLLLGLTQLRLAGFSLLPAVLWRPGSRGRARALAASLLPAAGGLLAWVAWSQRSSHGVGEFHVFSLFYAYRDLGWLHPLKVLADNVRFYLGEWGGCYLPPAWSAAGAFLGAVLAALALRGAWRAWPEDRARPAILMLAGTAAMHAVWPWQYDRYLIPLLPWLLWLLAAGTGARARWLLALLLAAQLGSHTHRWVLGRHSWRTPELARTYEWVRTRTAPSDAITSALPLRDGFHCARPSLPLPRPLDAEGFAAQLRRYRVRLVLWQEELDVGLSLPRDSAAARRLAGLRAILEDGRRFRLVHEDAVEGARIYELR